MSSEARATLAQEALALHRAGRVAEAIDAYTRLLAEWPASPDCWYNLAVLQRQQSNYSAALLSYAEALVHHVAEPEAAHLNRSVIYSDYLQQPESAERELLAALHLNPNYVPALFNLAGLHEDLGRKEAAEEIYERMLKLTGDSPEILARYANLRTFLHAGDPLISRLQRALRQPGIAPADCASVGFALGRALDACGVYDEAFLAYQAANHASRRSAGPGFRPYDRAAMELLVERIIRAFPSRPNLTAASPSRRDSPQPIFICGMFRSGSTLVEQLLAGHPEVAAAGELDFLPRAIEMRLNPYPESVATTSAGASMAHLNRLAAEYIALLRSLAAGAPFVTDKRPDNFLYIGLIKLMLPQARIIHTTRDALDNCLSVYFLHLDQGMSYALDLADIGHYFMQYRRLMGHWKNLFAFDIHDVHYDLLVRDPRTIIEETLTFLGLNWCEECLTPPQSQRAIKTASVWQVREPLYTRSSGRASHYPRQMRALRQYLEGAAGPKMPDRM
jgi:tetratricopeptide (TPR) repeat protein